MIYDKRYNFVAKNVQKVVTWKIGEETAVLAYYLSISYRLQDILTTAQIAELNSKKNNAAQHPELIKWIKSFYALKSPGSIC
jgi:hypothetical protein